MGIALLFQNPDTGDYYDLTDNLINFGKFSIGDFKRIKALVKNTDEGRPALDILIKATAHPTNQVGPAADTYESCLLAFDEAGPYYTELTVNSLSGGATKDLWIQWSISPEAMPGTGIFAIKAAGRYEL